MIEKRFLRNVSLEMSRQKLNQKQLAEKSGVDVQRITRIMIGTTVPRITDLEKFAKALGVSMQSLIERPCEVVHLVSPVTQNILRAGQE